VIDVPTCGARITADMLGVAAKVSAVYVHAEPGVLRAGCLCVSGAARRANAPG